MRTQRAADLVSAGFLAALAVIVLLASTKIRAGAGEGLHPRTFPVLLGGLLLAAGAALFVSAWRSRPGAGVDWPGRDGAMRIAAVLGILTAYLLLIQALGFAISTALAIPCLMRYLGKYRWTTCAAVGLASAIVLYSLFYRFLGLSLPMGPLG